MISEIIKDNDVKNCSVCDGGGRVPEERWGSPEIDMAICLVCGGSGRSRIITVSAVNAHTLGNGTMEIEVPFDFELENN